MSYSLIFCHSQSPLSYVPNPFTEFTTKMDFHQRFWNTVNSLIEKFFYEIFHFPNQKRLYNKFFPSALNSFEDVYKNSSIIFINRHVLSFGSTPRLPNMVRIALLDFFSLIFPFRLILEEFT